MLTRLEYDEKNPGRSRQLLDQNLQVTGWRSAGGVRARPRRSDVPDNAPAWWQGDEEASQTFLKAMNVVVARPS